jgi:hypothetical protein
MKTKLKCRQHWSASQIRSFRGVSSCGRDTDWVKCLNQEGDPFKRDNTKL